MARKVHLDRHLPPVHIRANVFNGGINAEVNLRVLFGNDACFSIEALDHLLEGVCSQRLQSGLPPIVLLASHSRCFLLYAATRTQALHQSPLLEC